MTATLDELQTLVNGMSLGQIRTREGVRDSDNQSFIKVLFVGRPAPPSPA